MPKVFQRQCGTVIKSCITPGDMVHGPVSTSGAGMEHQFEGGGEGVVPLLLLQVRRCFGQATALAPLPAAVVAPSHMAALAVVAAVARAGRASHGCGGGFSHSLWKAFTGVATTAARQAQHQGPGCSWSVASSTLSRVLHSRPSLLILSSGVSSSSSSSLWPLAACAGQQLSTSTLSAASLVHVRQLQGSSCTSSSTFTSISTSSSSRAAEVLAAGPSNNQKVHALQLQELPPHGPYLTVFTRPELCMEGGLQRRDLRVIDPTFPDEIFTITVRQSAILVNLLAVKAMIFARRMLLLEPLDMKSPIVEQLMSKLSDASVGWEGQPVAPFEFRALEALLDYACEELKRRAEAIEAQVGPILKLMAKHAEGADLIGTQELLPLKTELAELENEVNQLKAALDELLKNDEDMAAMYLTVKTSAGHQRRTDQHQEMEELLETMLKRVSETAITIHGIHRNVSATEEAVRLMLASARNTLIKTELFFTIATFAVACGAVVTGVFGMNLVTHMENNPYAFPIASASVLVISAIVLGASLKYCRKRRIW
eukprot:jgi/Chlat1/863/Chrsp107S01342